jgi:hypothetical protein
VPSPTQSASPHPAPAPQPAPAWAEAIRGGGNAGDAAGRVRRYARGVRDCCAQIGWARLVHRRCARSERCWVRHIHRSAAALEQWVCAGALPAGADSAVPISNPSRCMPLPPRYVGGMADGMDALQQQHAHRHP